MEFRGLGLIGEGNEGDWLRVWSLLETGIFFGTRNIRNRCRKGVANEKREYGWICSLAFMGGAFKGGLFEFTIGVWASL